MRKPIIWSAIIVIAIATANAQTPGIPLGPQMRGDGSAPGSRPFSITRLDPALDQIISPDAQLIELANGFGLTEGGLWMSEGGSGFWIFAGLLDNVLYKVTPDKKVSI
jgi:hypothetical protein